MRFFAAAGVAIAFSLALVACGDNAEADCDATLCVSSATYECHAGKESIMSITATKAKPDDGLATEYTVAAVSDGKPLGEESRVIAGNITFHIERIPARDSATATFTTAGGHKFARQFQYRDHCANGG